MDCDEGSAAKRLAVCVVLGDARGLRAHRRRAHGCVQRSLWNDAHHHVPQLELNKTSSTCASRSRRLQETLIRRRSSALLALMSSLASSAGAREQHNVLFVPGEVHNIPQVLPQLIKQGRRFSCLRKGMQICLKEIAITISSNHTVNSLLRSHKIQHAGRNNIDSC